MKTSAKPKRIITRLSWSAIKRDWMEGQIPIRDIAVMHQINPSTIYRHAASQAWPARGETANPSAAPDDPASAAQILYADLTAALRDSLKDLRRGTPSPSPRTAEMIRAHRRALTALLDAQRPARLGTKDAPSPAPAQLDLSAARTEILARLQALSSCPNQPNPTDAPSAA